MRGPVRCALLAALALAAAAAGPAPAHAQAARTEQELEGKPIREIVFEGARRLSPAFLREQIRLKVGDPYTRKALDDDVKRLYAAGHVGGAIYVDPPAEVAGGVRLVFHVSELDEVLAVEYEGLSSVSDRELRESPEGMRIRPREDDRPGTTFEEYRARLDVETILRMVREKGKFFAEVDVDRVPLPEGVKVIFRVREGPTVRVGEIEFIGNENQEGDTLTRYMKTQTTVFYFIRSGYFDRRALDDDLHNLERYYWGEGWLDVRALVEDLVFNDDRSRVTVVIRIIEGERYRVRKVDVTGASLFEPATVESGLETKEGEFFSGRKLATDMEHIQTLYMDRGYVFNRIDFKRRLVEGERAIDLTFDIEEGVKVTIEKVRFEGNVRTRDDVIRRELEIFPGEPFHATNMNESKDRLGRRGYFKDLRVNFEPGTAPDRRDLVVRVDEADTGQLLFGGGISSSTGLFARIVFAQRNFDILDVPTSLDDIVDGHFFVGGGQTLLLEAVPGQERSRYSVTFIEPYLLPDRIPLPIQFRTTFSYYDSVVASTYDEQRLESQVGLGYRTTRDSIVELTYRITDTTIFNLRSFAPAPVIEVAGDNLVSAMMLSFNVAKNKVDQNQVFYGGWGAGLEFEAAGGVFGGEYDFIRLDGSVNVQHTLFQWPRSSKHVIGGKISAGWMSEYGNRNDDVPFFEKFFAGGPRSVRGFEFRSVGPQQDDEPVGGKARVVGTVEYSFPIIPGFDETYSPEWRADFLRGVLFCDVGNVEEDLESFTFDDFRVAIGFGFRIKIPVFPAPVALDFGFAVKQEDFDDEELFSFSIGTGL